MSTHSLKFAVIHASPEQIFLRERKKGDLFVRLSACKYEMWDRGNYFHVLPLHLRDEGVMLGAKLFLAAHRVCYIEAR